MASVSNPILVTGEPYTPGLTREAVCETYGVLVDEIAKLGSAENPLGPSPKALIAIAAAMGLTEQYPSWTAEPLRKAIAARYDVAPDEVVCGTGETEVISFIIRAYAGVGDKILMYRPCFPIYHLFAENEGRVPVYVDMGREMDFRVDAYVEALKSEPIRIAFLTNPHSPSGKLMAEADIRRICEAAGDALVVMDEAYIHFTETEGSLHLVKEFPNLIVLRTFSKAFGLAGLRAGFGIAAPEIIRPLWNIKPTWNMGHMQMAGAAAALTDHEHIRRTVDLIVEMRGYIAQRMSGLTAFRMVPGSRSNFFLIEVMDDRLDSTIVFEKLLERGVIIKDGSVSFRGLDKRFLRSDVGSKVNMDRLADALAAIEQSL
ncbi:pyridoxal phosphate-dependent aminotransferase [Acuticoccus mangrovi]|uniref:Histidinol-phosphate aminotransferase family protein n=1 Tax=Acuticoccus mangrovi TaxID=2796142 RepID=A0A934MFQ7_9HYPH|nr:histidinol-phosphate transaminase [Acuticoccus mangrovi]MBJ3774146.1 histidinol-phosphate aminotransferase family protein [Acuticoccus mangrovi]